MTSINNKIFARFIVIMIFLIIAVMLTPTIMKMCYPLQYEELIYTYSKKNSVDPYLIMSIISVESGFDKDAVSSKNAKGLMQIKDETFEWCIEKFGIDENLSDHEKNIAAGCAYFRYLIDRFGSNTDLALAAYNAGEGNVSSWLKEYDNNSRSLLGSIPFAETEKYVEKVKKREKIYRFLYN